MTGAWVATGVYIGIGRVVSVEKLSAFSRQVRALAGKCS